MGWQFIKKLFCGIFESYGLITTLLSLVAFVFLLLFPKFRREGRTDNIKRKIQAMPLSCRLLIILGLLYISVMFSSYSIYAKQQQQIENLQKQIQDLKQIPNPKVRANPISQNPRHRITKPNQRLEEPKLYKPTLKGVSPINEPNKSRVML